MSRQWLTSAPMLRSASRSKPAESLAFPTPLASRKHHGIGTHTVATVPPLRARVPTPPIADGGTEPQPPAAGGHAAPAMASTCTPKGLSRPDFLSQPGATTQEFGLTRLSIGQVQFPKVETAKSRGGVVVLPTSAALPAIPSVFTTAGTFTEGEAHFINQGGGDCPSRRTPLRWTITAGAAARIAEAEQEHCADFQFAFDVSLKRYAEAVTAVAKSGRTFASQERAESAVQKVVGAAPADWRGIFICLAKKTLDRDSNHWHLPKHITRPPRLENDCAFARAIIHDTSLPQVGVHPSADLVQGCGERGPQTKGNNLPKPGANTGPSPLAPKLSAPRSVRSTSEDASDAPVEISMPSFHPASVRPQAKPLLQRKCACGDCASCRNRHLQRSATRHSSGLVVPGLVSEVLSRSGRPLDPPSRRSMEDRLGHDFSGVRIHDDARATQSAAEIAARAYTVGEHVVFGHGQFHPGSVATDRLLTHELTHVVQQRRSPLLANDPPQLEAEADRAEAAVSRGEAPAPVAASGVALARKEPEGGTGDPETQAADAELACDFGALCKLSFSSPDVVTTARLLAALQICSPEVSPYQLVGGNPCLTPNFGRPALPAAPAAPASPVYGPLPPPAATGGLSGLGDLLTVKTGPLTIELPKAVRVKLPIALSRARTLSIDLSAEVPAKFGLKITLDGLPHVVVSLKGGAEIDTKSGASTASAGLEIVSQNKVCNAVSAESTRQKVKAAGDKLNKAAAEFKTVKDDEKLGKAIDVASAIAEIYESVDKAKQACKPQPTISLDLGYQRLLTPGNETDPTKSPPLDKFGADLTVRF